MGDSVGGNLVLLFLVNWIVKIEFFNIHYQVPGILGLQDDVPMRFGGGWVWSWGGYWSILCEFVTAHGDSRYIRLFLLGSCVANKASVFRLAVLGGFVLMYGKIYACPLNVSDSLEEVVYLI